MLNIARLQTTRVQRSCSIYGFFDVQVFASHADIPETATCAANEASLRFYLETHLL